MHGSNTRLLLTALIAALALGGTACGKDKKKRKPRTKPAAPAAQKAPADNAADKTAAAPAAAGTATIQGTVKLDGEAPKMPKLKRDSDPVCAKTEGSAEVVLANDNGTLRNVVVRIKPGTVKGPAPTEPIAITQTDCVFRPRVQGATSGQEFTIDNKDPTSHNVHAFDMRTGEGEQSLFNLAQPQGSPAISKDTNGYDVLKLKCDIHPWMVAYIVVTDHPYFAVTGDDGSFKIEGVPPGKYTLEAWHEHYGMKTTEVEVADKATAQAEFTFAVADKPL